MPDFLFILASIGRRLGHRTIALPKRRPSRRAIIALVLCLLPGSAIAVAQTPSRAPTVHAAPQAGIAQAPAPANAASSAVPPAAVAPWSRTFELQTFMPQPAPITLHNSFDTVDLPIPLASRLEVTAATLHLTFTNSTALLPRRSQLRVLMNGAVVAQIPLSPSQPNVRADISIPPALLTYGFNTLTFDVAQHYTDQCENPGAPELWTQINTAKSTLVITGHLLPLATPNLSALGEFLGPNIGDTQHFVLLTATPTLSNAALRWGAILSEAVGLHLQYTPAHITWAVARPAGPLAANATTPQIDESEVAGHDGVLFGTEAELAPFLPPALRKQITNGFLGIYALNSDPTHFLLVVSGRTPNQVTRAAVALSVMNSPIANAPTALINQLYLRREAFFYPNARLHQGHSYRFSDIGFRTGTLKGSSPVRYKLHFTLSPDLYAPQSANVRLGLNFAYGANMRSDSVLNIYLNGKFNQAIRLDNPNGAVFRDYDIYIPLRDFQPGANTLTFEAVMVPLITSMSGQCATSQANNLLFTLFDTSRLVFPPAQHYTAQPSLKLFAHTGFPYGHMPFGADTAVRVAGHNPQVVSAAWTLLAKIAQIDDHALPLADVAFAGRPSNRHVIMVGPLHNISPNILAKAPIDLSHTATLAYPANNTETGNLANATFMQSLQILYDRLLAQGASGTVTPTERLIGRMTVGQSGIIEALESPWAANRTMTVFAAATPQALLARMQNLVEPDYWYQLAGNVALWQPSQKTMFTERAGSVFHVGQVNPINFARYYLSAYPLYWIGTLLGIGLVLALAIRIWTIRRRRRNLPGGSDAEI